MSRSKAVLALAAFMLLASTVRPATAQGVLWPGDAPCKTTLQACLNGIPEGSFVQILTPNPGSTVTGGSNTLSITKSVSLRPVSGTRVVFPEGVSISGTLAGPFFIEVSGITLTNGAMIFNSQNTSGTNSVRISRMELNNTTGPGGITIRQMQAGTLDLDINDNRYVRTGGAGNAISIESGGGGLVTGQVRFNRAHVPDSTSTAYGMLASTSTGRLDLDFHGNVIRGSFVRGALCGLIGASEEISHAGNVTFQNNVVIAGQQGSGTGICAWGGERGFNVAAVNNTLIGLSLGVDFRERSFNPPPTTQPLTGAVANNILYRSTSGWRRNLIASTVSNNANLYFGLGFNTIGNSPPSLAANSVFADPLLLSREFPYLREGSPAIDAGNALSIVLVTPGVDADGSRRFKGPSPDIGAYEFGDVWLRKVFEFTSDHVIDHPALNGQPNARLIKTRRHVSGSTNFFVHGAGYGVHGAADRWGISDQNFNATNAGSVFNIVVPAAGSGSFQHQVPGGLPLEDTALTDGSVTGNPEAIVLFTRNTTMPGSPFTNPRQLTVVEQPGGDWALRVQPAGSGLALPEGAGFNLLAQPRSPTAFEHVVDDFNLNGMISEIDHPLLNGKACAILLAVPRGDDLDGRQYALSYSSVRERWGVFSPDPSGEPMVEGSAFNILFSARQVVECSEKLVLFADGFEG